MTTELSEFSKKLQTLHAVYSRLKQDIDSFANNVQVMAGVIQISGFTSTISASSSFEGVRLILRENEESDRLTNIAILTLLRTVWEDFVEKEFSNLNVGVEEIRWVRNCFIHARGCVSKDLMDFYTRNPEKNIRGYKLGDSILLTREHIREYFRVLENSYSEYLTKKQT